METKYLSIELPADLRKRLKIKATEEGATMTAIVIRLIEQYLGEEEKQ